MIKDKKLSENILELLPKANYFLENYQKVIFDYLFGSLTWDKVLPLSDIDIAIYLKEDEDFSQEKITILRNSIDILGTLAPKRLTWLCLIPLLLHLKQG